MKNISYTEEKKPIYKTGYPEVGECFKYGKGIPRFYMRIEQDHGARAFNNLTRTDDGFYAVDLSTGKMCYFIGDTPDEYFILETTLNCSNIILSR